MTIYDAHLALGSQNFLDCIFDRFGESLRYLAQADSRPADAVQSDKLNRLPAIHFRRNARHSFTCLSFSLLTLMIFLFALASKSSQVRIRLHQRRLLQPAPG